MARRGTNRNLKAQIRKRIFKDAYQCRIQAETISRTNQTEAVAIATSIDPEAPPQMIPKIERGLVLRDSRGRGAWQ